MHLLRRLRRYLPGKRDLSGRYAVSDRSGRLHRLRRLRRRLPRRRDQAGRVIQTKAKQAARGVAPRKLCFFRGYSSSGRALEWHSRGGRFESVYLHQVKIIRTFWQQPIGSDLFYCYKPIYLTLYDKTSKIYLL